MPKEVRHIPVLLDEVLDSLRPGAGDMIVDCTVGLGGHSAALLSHVQPGGRVIGLDMDPASLALAKTKLDSVGREYSLHHMNFAG